MTKNELIDQLLELETQPSSVHTSIEKSMAESFRNAESCCKAERLKAELLDHLLREPGEFICIPDPAKRRAAEKLVEALWKENVDENEEFHTLIHNGVRCEGNPPIHFDSIGDGLGTTYHLRVRRVKPTFVSTNLPPEIRCCLERAMEAWVHGLDVAAVILCWSVLEVQIRDRLASYDEDLVYQPPIPGRRCRNLHPWSKILQNAVNMRILDAKEKDTAQKIHKTRNNVVHDKLEGVTEDQAYEVVTDARTLLEVLIE